MSRSNSRTSGIARLTAVTLSLTVLVGIGWGETSSAEDQRERILATDYSSIQEAIDSARELGIRHIYVPAGKYEIAKTLNLTRFHGGILEGAGCYTTIIQAATGSTPGMDLTNSSAMVLKNFQLTGTGSVGILMRGKSQTCSRLKNLEREILFCTTAQDSKMANRVWPFLAGKNGFSLTSPLHPSQSKPEGIGTLR